MSAPTLASFLGASPSTGSAAGSSWASGGGSSGTGTANGTNGTNNKRRRQRSPSPPATRKKSCEACRKAKARCSETLPRCSRCERKAIDCDYGGTRHEENVGAGAGAGIHTQDPNLVQLMMDRTAAGGDNTIGAGFPASYIEALSSTDAFAIAGVNTHADPICLSGDVDSPEGGSSVYSDGSSRGYQTSMTSHDGSPEPWSTSAHAGGKRTEASTFTAKALPFTLQSYYQQDGTKEITVVPNAVGDGSFNTRFVGFNVEWPVQGSLSSGNRVVGAFELWPTLMVRGERLPPFIHPHFPSLQVSEATTVAAAMHSGMPGGQQLPPRLPESLANCSSVCTMFYNKTPENSAFVWKNIKREQERVYGGYREWPAREVLFGFQAMIIYSFLRMIDGEHEYNNFDMAFVLTISELGTRLWGDEMRALQARKAEPAQANWADWLLAESVCRTGMVFQWMFIALQLYRAVPPNPGCRGIDDHPLPCGRRLWQARSHAEWLREYAAYQRSRKSTRLLTFGDLRSLRPDVAAAAAGGESTLTQDERDDLAAWAADLDDFGSLTLVAGLAGPNSTLEDYRRTFTRVV